MGTDARRADPTDVPVTRREVLELRRTTLHLNAEIVRLREQVRGLEARAVVYLRPDDAGPVTCSGAGA